jgi:pimeloyl-ACP methyl ester carboxylesterase
MIAGVASDSISWQLQTAELQKDFRLVLFDNRGVGRSPVPEGPISLESMAQDALDVLDAHEVESAHVVSHSMGSAIAQTLARRHPNRVRKMALAAPFPNLTAQGKLAVEGWVLGLEQGCTPELFGRLLFPWLFTDAFLSQSGYFEICLEGMKNHPYPLTAKGLRRQCEALEDFDSTDWLGEVFSPTLLLAGSQDILTPPHQAEKMAKLMPNAKLHLLDAGHSALVEKAGEFNAVVREFLLG